MPRAATAVKDHDGVRVVDAMRIKHRPKHSFLVHGENTWYSNLGIKRQALRQHNHSRLKIGRATKGLPFLPDRNNGGIRTCLARLT